MIIEKCSMEINYIILAHRGPRQVARLLEKLITPECRFYIHIDKDVDIAPFRRELNHFSNIYLLTSDQRISAIWADFGMVQATINCMRQIITDQRKGYCVLMSGQDYPIKNANYIIDFFSRQYGTNFIQGYPIGPSICADQGIRRINRYKINLSKKRNDILMFPSIYDREFYRKFNLKLFLTLVKRKSILSCIDVLPKLFKKRTFPSYVKPYKGSQWWALPIETIHLIINFIQQHPDYLDYHLYTFAPDEIFFQSIIFSLLDKAHIREEVTYVNWPQNSWGPLLLKEINFKELLSEAQFKLFARKFDMEVDAVILDMIDREALKFGSKHSFQFTK